MIDRIKSTNGAILAWIALNLLLIIPLIASYVFFLLTNVYTLERAFSNGFILVFLIVIDLLGIVLISTIINSRK